MMVRICRRMCKTCIFKPGNLMHLAPGRVDEMVRQSVAHEACIPCHSTLDDGPYNVLSGGSQSVCRGFYDRHATQPLQVAQRLELIEWT